MKMSKKILCVDDETGILESYKWIFDGRYDTLLAKDGKEALEKVAEHGCGKEGIGVILMDINMDPGMNGIEAITKIRDSGYSVPIYITSANPEQGDEVRKKYSGIGVCSKPFRVADLISIVEKELKKE